MDAAQPDIDRILEAIRAEARARGSKGRIGGYPGHDAGSASPGASLAMVEVVTHGVIAPEVRHVADLLCLPIDVFLPQAYERILGRPADAGGAAHWYRQMLQGRLTRVEVIGRLLLSPEGRARRSRIGGVWPAFVMGTFYRVPLAGPLLALLARILRLPMFLQDRSAMEAAALAAGTWMKR